MIRKTATALLLIILALLPLSAAQDWLKYEVKVDALLVPLFAMDNKGNPVTDLTMQDFILHIDGKPSEITYFKAFKYELKDSGTQVTPIPGGTTPASGPQHGGSPPERVIFIIVDTVFNSGTGIIRSRNIASELITKAPPSDRFILIEFNPANGLKHLGGPNMSRQELLVRLGKVTASNTMWASVKNRNVRNPRLSDRDPGSIAAARGGAGDGDVVVKRPSYMNNRENPIGMEASLEKSSLEMDLDKQAYQNSMKLFSRVLARFKYALKTITQPKLVFLISQGVIRGAFTEDVSGTGIDGAVIGQNRAYSGFMLNYARQVVKGINDGGSLLYTINPRPLNIPESAGEVSLKYMAYETGGKYFTGRDTEKILKHIRNTITAYYEVAFYVPPSVGERFDIRFKCKRKGVKIHTLAGAERTRAYKQMSPEQKKVFALDAVTGGNWSRIVGKVVKLALTDVFDSEKKKNVIVPLEQGMRDRPLDVFVIHMDPKTMEADFTIDRMQGPVSLAVAVKKVKNKRTFLLLVEPEHTLCVYNELK